MSTLGMSGAGGVVASGASGAAAGSVFGPVGIGVGAGLGIIAGLFAASAQADAAEREAQMNEMRANELLERQKINEGIMYKQSGVAQHEFGAAFAATGKAGGGIGGQLTIKRNFEESIINSRRAAEFQANMIRMGAEGSRQAASDARTAGWIGAAGTALNAAGTYYRGFGQKKKSEDLYT